MNVEAQIPMFPRIPPYFHGWTHWSFSEIPNASAVAEIGFLCSIVFGGSPSSCGCPECVRENQTSQENQFASLILTVSKSYLL